MGGNGNVESHFRTSLLRVFRYLVTNVEHLLEHGSSFGQTPILCQERHEKFSACIERMHSIARELMERENGGVGSRLTRVSMESVR